MDTVRDECTIFPDGIHYFTFDATSNASQSVFCCICGEVIYEAEDAGTGA